MHRTIIMLGLDRIAILYLQRERPSVLTTGRRGFRPSRVVIRKLVKVDTNEIPIRPIAGLV